METKGSLRDFTGSEAVMGLNFVAYVRIEGCLRREWRIQKLRMVFKVLWGFECPWACRILSAEVQLVACFEALRGC